MNVRDDVMTVAGAHRASANYSDIWRTMIDAAFGEEK
jgi:hypothetical protein